jgi:hypothetical protein
MRSKIRTYTRSAMVLGAAAALTVAGVALAQGGSGDATSAQSDPPTKILPAGIPGPPGPEQNLTYAEFHVMNNGQAEVVRLDAGKVVSASDSSITLGENDGNEVTIPVDNDTQVIAGPTRRLGVADLKSGGRVSVVHPANGAADAILLAPKLGDLPVPRGLPSKGEIFRHGRASVRILRAHGAHLAFKGAAAPPVGAGWAIVGPRPKAR